MNWNDTFKNSVFRYCLPNLSAVVKWNMKVVNMICDVSVQFNVSQTSVKTQNTGVKITFSRANLLFSSQPRCFIRLLNILCNIYLIIRVTLHAKLKAQLEKSPARAILCQKVNRRMYNNSNFIWFDFNINFCLFHYNLSSLQGLKQHE